MATRYVRTTNRAFVTFAPGDQVIRYIDGQAFFCTVVQIEPDDQVRVSCHLWPSGYSALVKPQDVALVSRSGMAADL
jgi:hypothetical protein